MTTLVGREEKAMNSIEDLLRQCLSRCADPHPDPLLAPREEGRRDFTGSVDTVLIKKTTI